MTLEDFHAARLVDDQHVISVGDHKTAASYGPAKIVLSPTLHSWLVIFADKIRCPLVPANSQVRELFISWHGESMTSGQITKCIQSACRKAGLGDAISMIIVRKTAVSTVHQTRPELSSQLADLTCHRLATAQKCYRVVERDKTSVAASKGIREAMTSTHKILSKNDCSTKQQH